MNDLPTRAWVVDAHDHDEWEEGTLAIVDAYADGTLLTEQEWQQNLDMTAFVQVVVNWAETNDSETVGTMLGRGLAAAFGDV